MESTIAFCGIIILHKVQNYMKSLTVTCDLGVNSTVQNTDESAIVYSFWFHGDKTKLYRQRWFPSSSNGAQSMADEMVMRRFGDIFNRAMSGGLNHWSIPDSRTKQKLKAVPSKSLNNSGSMKGNIDNIQPTYCIPLYSKRRHLALIITLDQVCVV